MNSSAEHAGALLTIDLDAIVANWRMLGEKLGETACAAVVKADAYGLGAVEVSRALHAAGCRDFFVAHLDEAIALRHAGLADARIMVLNGTPCGTEADFSAAGIIPVVNTMKELAGWREHASKSGRAMPVILQADTGMSRLGLCAGDIARIAGDGSLLAGLSVKLFMSHLACADEPAHPANRKQLQAFETLRKAFPDVPASLANSSGIFLGRDFHFDMARPGAALYGINPTPGLPNPMRAVTALRARVVQRHEVPSGSGIGYGHRAIAGGPVRLATISLGYADGWPRSAEAAATFRGATLPFVGTVSMDTIILDVTDCAEPPAEGDFVELIGPQQSVDDIARAGGTIGYEILTRLGKRFHRRYVGKAEAARS